jgi:hypothetical protein
MELRPEISHFLRRDEPGKALLPHTKALTQK